jgi:pimeloyl-ACP methyl ester carboxylesterase
MRNFMRALALAALALIGGAAWAQKPSGIGVVLLHGMGGNAMSMSTLSYELRERGHLVSAPELPWSAMRNHDVTTDAALREVEREVEGLRKKGARRVVLAGFSKGGLFAAYAASRHPPDALVLISPNGITRAADIEAAQRLKAEGKGAEKTALELFDPVSQRRYPIFTTPDAFVSWFGPDSAMKLEPLLAGLPHGLPVLLVVATRDFDNLRDVKHSVYEGLPAHPAKRLYEPDSNHIGAVNASAAEVVRWIGTTLRRR